MSLTVKHLNADATFLLTFAPSFAPSNSKRKFPGSFTILFDPWLDGDSIIYHPKFANSRHSTPPAIKTLAGLQDEIDVIVISQEKADHLSRETLCSLPRDTTIRILATAKAVKKIRGWKYFYNPSILQVMQPYEVGKESSILRIPIDPYSSASADGEITIANIFEKRDITGLHNAIGITYCPPGTVLTNWDGSTTKLERMPMMAKGENDLPKSPISPSRPNHRDVRGRTKERDFVFEPTLLSQQHNDDTALPPFAPLVRMDSALTRPSTSGSRAPGVSTVAKRPDNHEKVMSVIYTPHGLDAAAIKPYIDNHLRQLNFALPVTALFHSLNTEANPWWLGGTVLKGAPGGVKIAQDAHVRYWISAHDEIKELKGFATKLTKSRRYDAEEVVKMLGGGDLAGTEVCTVECGETRKFV